MVSFRLSYPATIPFPFKIHVLLCIYYVLAFAGLLVWNFLTSAKGLQCTSYASASYQPDTCEATPLNFASTYYTRPISSHASNGTIGTFPWVPLGFGDGADVAIDYTKLNLNWTANALNCVPFEQSIVLHLDSEGSTVNACYYCGGNLRILCTTIDSERAQVPSVSQAAYVNVLDRINTLSIYAHRIATTAQSGATVGSVRIVTQTQVQGLPSDVLPYQANSFQVTLGSTAGSFPVYSNNSNAGVAQVVNYASQLSAFVQQTTSLDLQPAAAGGEQRTLQVSYLCKSCAKHYKPTLEIIALLITGVFGVIGTAFGIAKMVAEWFSPAPTPATSGSSTGSIYGGPALGKVNSNLPSPALSPGPTTPMYQSYVNSSTVPTQPYQTSAPQPYQHPAYGPYTNMPYSSPQQTPYQQQGSPGNP